MRSAVPDCALVADLCRPEAFPNPRPERIDVTTSHTSWVLLGDDEVWKVKRPVDFGFLDFSDPAKRLQNCQEEIRLGGRLAPQVYLGLAPVYQGPDGYSFVGPGRVVDHAVRMRRLRDEESALGLLRAGQLHAAHLRSLADHLARFYASAPVVPELGTTGILAANVEENHTQLQPYVGRYLDAAVEDYLHRWQLGFLASHDEAFAERLAEDRIREGHGDLRLEHVYFPSDRGGLPIVIDAIEFNRRFRCLDVALDVAFFAMELEAEKRSDLAAYFLSCFARASNDYGFYELLDFYVAYRACVRAKVACFVAADPGTPRDKSRRKQDEARRLLDLASRAAHRPRRPRVIAVGGLIGAGKSTLADRLSAELGLPVISSDATRKFLGGVAPTDRGPPALYGEAMTRATHDEMFRRARRVLEAGRGVILDATFRDADQRASARALARYHDCPFVFLELRCDEATLRKRLRQRGPGALSDAREGLLARIQREYEAPDELPIGERLVLDATEDPGALARTVRTQIL